MMRWFGYVIGCFVAGVVALNLYFFAAIASWQFFDPSSTSFMRAERMRLCGGLGRVGVAGEDVRGDPFMFGPGAGAVVEFAEYGRHRAAHMRPLRRDHLLDGRVAR